MFIEATGISLPRALFCTNQWDGRSRVLLNKTFCFYFLQNEDECRNLGKKLEMLSVATNALFILTFLCGKNCILENNFSTSTSCTCRPNLLYSTTGL